MNNTKMKDSGIDWLGIIPEHWDTIRVKYLVSILNGKEIENEEGEIPVYGSGGLFKYTDKWLYAGTSVLLGRKGTIDKPQLVSGKFWTVDTAFYTRFSKDICADFFYYLANCFDYNKYQSGSTIPSMTQTALSNIVIPKLNLDEQKQIVNFLDRKCSNIDSIISDLEKQIEIFEKYKKAVITEAVTKGLNRNVVIKETTNNLFIKIPSSWKVGRLKDVIELLTDFTSNGSFASLAKNVQYLENDGYARLIRLTDLRVEMENDGLFVNEMAYKFLGNSSLFGGEILVASVGAYAGLFCEMPRVNYPATIGPNMYLIKTNPRIMHQHFLFYLGQSDLIAEQLRMKSIASAQPKLNKHDVKTISITIPPLHEQSEIISFLDNKCPEVDTIIKGKKNQIETIKKYKNSLIYEYVTGKKRVSQGDANE